MGYFTHQARSIPERAFSFAQEANHVRTIQARPRDPDQAVALATARIAGTKQEYRR
ncbi:hypothetical protein MTBUT4_260037 [Magnetospirillum sp. UT-4]|nr:hypothetical protein MTBUT4_260037 [Magnetospirillum sp. UT-4]